MDSFVNGGFGKIILFGEHFVVYGQKAIVAALPFRTYASVSYSSECQWRLIDNRPKVPTYSATKHSAYLAMMKTIALAMEIHTPLEITLFGDLPVTSGGIGASAAAAVAICRALNVFLGKTFSAAALNQIAFEGECCIHGHPSGIDNCAAFYGGIFVYDRQTGPLSRMTCTLSSPLELVIADSGRTSNTANIIAVVREKMMCNPNHMEHLVRQYAQLVQPGICALQSADWVALGQLMNQNHQILKDIDLSSPELDAMVCCALQNGALGAKLTGSGKGGIMIALTPGIEQQNTVAQALTKQGNWTLKVSLEHVLTGGLQVL